MSFMSASVSLSVLFLLRFAFRFRFKSSFFVLYLLLVCLPPPPSHDLPLFYRYSKKVESFPTLRFTFVLSDKQDKYCVIQKYKSTPPQINVFDNDIHTCASYLLCAKLCLLSKLYIAISIERKK